MLLFFKCIAYFLQEFGQTAFPESPVVDAVTGDVLVGDAAAVQCLLEAVGRAEQEVAFAYFNGDARQIFVPNISYKLGAPSMAVAGLHA